MSGVSRPCISRNLAVSLRISLCALVLMLILPAARAQRDPTGHYAAPAPGQPLCALRIHVTGFRNQKGKVGGTVFASPAGFPEKTANAVVHGGWPITGPEVTEEFQLPPGRYAVAVIHDENSNKKLDRNMLGIPKEGFGFANNPRVLFTPPSFQASSIQVGCPVTEIGIKMIYK